MDDRRVADYFVIAGLPENPQPLEQFSNEAVIKPTHKQDPITDVCVINKGIGEKVPKGFLCLERTPSGLPADLNHGSIRCPEMYLCYRRSRERPPLTDIGILYEGKERLMDGCEVVHTTPFGHPANVNNSNSSRIYITYRRSADIAASDTLAVVDICIILTNKNENPPHAYNQIHKNLNKGMVGSDVYLCYKKAMTKSDVLAYKPAVLGRYPLQDYDNFVLPESVPMFCLPMGATLECWSSKAQHPLPVFSTFVLTESSGEKVYGAAVTFYEEFPEEKLTDLQMRSLGLKKKHIRDQYSILKTVHYNKCICLLSHWPFFDAFKKFLIYLYKISITGSHTVPLERHISHFMFDVPYPSPQRPRILVQLSQDSVSLAMPEDSPLSQSAPCALSIKIQVVLPLPLRHFRGDNQGKSRIKNGASYITMLKNLGPENCMTVLSYILLENKLLIHSLRPAVLTGVAEAFSTMIFPFHWQCPYIPLCPLGLSDVLNAPCPFIVGIDSRYFDLYDPPPDVICVDLDTNMIWPPDDKKNLTFKLLPKKPAKVLQETLHKLFDKVIAEPSHSVSSDDVSLELAPLDFDFRRKRKEMEMELTIQEAFLRFTASLLRGYKQFLKPITRAPTVCTTDASSLFDMQGFLKSREKSYTKFFTQLMRTQMYIRFIEERSFVSDKDAGLAFFDECAEKVIDSSDEPKLIEIDSSQKSERTVFITPPETIGLPEGVTYSYNGFPELKPELFLIKNPSSVSLAKISSGPGSPMVARRSKHEVKTAQKLALQYVSTPHLWAKCLLSHCYSLWFIHLPAFVKSSPAKLKTLRIGYDVLRKMHTVKLQPPDEICYRVMLQLCGQLNQPVLAIRVYIEMKRAGVQPNAITYGHYNRAVFEGKWPSPNSKGIIMWNKLRNVIYGVAQFRRSVKRRSVSLYSNSESDFDQLSRTSVDSYLEDAPDKSDVIKTDIIIDMVEGGVNRGSIEERMSTGGVSDRGYSSMTPEDAKRLSQVLSTEELAEMEQMNAKKLKKENRNPLRLNFRRKAKKKEHTESNSTNNVLKNKEPDDLMLPSKDQRLIMELRPRHGSIVKKSQSSVSSSDDQKSCILDSSAGILMVSQQSVHNSSLIHSSEELNEKNRRRHRSAGDYQNKPRSSSLLLNWKLRSTDDKCMEYTQFTHDEVDDETFEENSESLDKTLILDTNNSSLAKENNTHDSGIVINESNIVTDSRTSLSSVSDPVCINGNSVGYRPVKEKRLSDDSSASLSPQHIQGTPVTENDPLGLFNIPEPILSTANSKSSPSRSPHKYSTLPPSLSSTPFSNFDNKDMNGRPKLFKTVSVELEKCNRNDDKAETRSLDIIETDEKQFDSSKNRFKPTLADIGRTNSTPDNLSAPAKSKFSVWALKGYFHSPLSSKKSNDSLDSKKEESILEFGLRRAQGLSKAAVSGAYRSASVVATKLNEFKQSMSTPTKYDSNSSLAHTSDSEISEEDRNKEQTSSFKGSRDYLSRSDSLTCQDDSSIDGIRQFSFAGSSQSASYLDGNFSSKDIGDFKNTNQFQSLLTVISKKYMEVDMYSCTYCSKCHSLLYDEEIMAGWSADDSNLMTSCPFCAAKLVPNLNIYVKDLRSQENKNAEVLANKEGSIPSNLDQTPVMFGIDLVDSDTSEKGSNKSSPTHVQMKNQIEKSKDADLMQSSMQLSDNVPKFSRRCASECFTSSTDSCVQSDSFDGLGLSPDDSVLEDPDSTCKGISDLKKDFSTRSVDHVDPITVPYLSPIVLRKELENVLESEGDSSLASDVFVDEHPIIFWNLVWYFKRIGVPSAMPEFLLTAKSINDETSSCEKKLSPDSRHVAICTHWDNLQLQQEYGIPMYKAWNAGPQSSTIDALVTESQAFSRQLMHQIIMSIQCNDVIKPIKLIIDERRRHKRTKMRFRSLYRDILFLSILSCGRDNIDHDAFDREFTLAFQKVSPGELKRLQRNDKPRNIRVIWCRKAFGKLEL